MKNKNSNSTRFYSDAHEKSVCKALDGYQTSNSGAGQFTKGDVLLKNLDMLIECKTCMNEKESFSIKKEWLEKNKIESFAMRKSNSALCFNFGPNQKNYYIIDEKLMCYLVGKLKEEENS